MVKAMKPDPLKQENQAGKVSADEVAAGVWLDPTLRLCFVEPQAVLFDGWWRYQWGAHRRTW